MTKKTTINKDVALWGCEDTSGLFDERCEWLFSGERPVADVPSKASLYRQTVFNLGELPAASCCLSTNDTNVAE